jgi:hypothetical protein
LVFVTAPRSILNTTSFQVTDFIIVITEHLSLSPTIKKVTPGSVHVQFTIPSNEKICCNLHQAVTSGSLIASFVKLNASLYGMANIELEQHDAQCSCGATQCINEVDFVVVSGACLRRFDCGEGYNFDNKSSIRNQCVDIDECASANPCQNNGTICSNTAGSYECQADGGASKSAEVADSLLGAAIVIAVVVAIIVLAVVYKATGARMAPDTGAAPLTRHVTSSHIHFKETLGDGRYGPVYHGYMKGPNGQGKEEVMVQRALSANAKGLEGESGVLQTLSHPYIASFVADDNNDDGDVVLVLFFFSFGIFTNLKFIITLAPTARGMRSLDGSVCGV